MLTIVAALAPKSTAVAPARPLPLIVTGVLPATGPIAGLMVLEIGGWEYVNCTADEIHDVPLGVTTVTTTLPAAPAGLLTVIVVPLALSHARTDSNAISAK